MKNNTTVERRVLVCFKKDVPQEIIDNFFIGLDELRSLTQGLLNFHLQKFLNVPNEEGLNSAVSNVIFPDIMSVWTFKDEAALLDFLTCQKHLTIAKEKFRPAVEQRIVFNSGTFMQPHLLI